MLFIYLHLHKVPQHQICDIFHSDGFSTLFIYIHLHKVPQHQICDIFHSDGFSTLFIYLHLHKVPQHQICDIFHSDGFSTLFIYLHLHKIPQHQIGDPQLTVVPRQPPLSKLKTHLIPSGDVHLLSWKNVTLFITLSKFFFKETMQKII